MDVKAIMNDEPGAIRLDPKHEQICNCMVEMHQAVKDRNAVLMKSAKKYNFITPRDFLNFIKQFIGLFKEKSDSLNE